MTGYVDKREIPYIMKYLLQFPSELQTRDYIITKLEDDEPSDNISYDRFAPFMLDVLLNNEFEPASTEVLLTAFRKLDPKQTGRIPLDVLKELMMSTGIPLREKEQDQFS